MKNTIPEPTQPANIEQVPVETVVPQKTDTKLLLCILAVIVVLALGIAGYFGYQNLQLRKAPVVPTQPTVTPSTSISPSPILDPTAGWKLLSDFESGVSLKYPESLTLEKRQNNYFVLLADPNNPQSVVVSIDARLAGNYADYDYAVATTKAGLTDIQVQEMNNGTKISGKVGPGFGEGQQVIIALLRYQQGAIEVTTTSTDQVQLQIVDQILSTFEFVE